MQAEWVKIGDFRQITGYISKTVQDRSMISIKVIKFCRKLSKLADECRNYSVLHYRRLFETECITRKGMLKRITLKHFTRGTGEQSLMDAGRLLIDGMRVRDVEVTWEGLQ